MARVLLWFLICASLVVLQSCTNSSYYVTESPLTTSANDADQLGSGTETRGLKNNNSPILPVKILLIGKDIAMVIPPLANTASLSGSNQNFVFEMIITAHKPGVIINTANLVYTSVRGEQYRSKGLLTYQGGHSQLSRAENYAPECVWPENINAHVDKNTIELQADKDYCIAVWFKSPLPEFDQPFEIQISGIMDNGKQTRVPVLQYSPVSRQFIQKP